MFVYLFVYFWGNGLGFFVIVFPPSLRFRTGRPELGYSAHIADGAIVVETVSKGKRPQVHRVTTPASSSRLQLHRWYMVTVAYARNRVRSSQLCCYVDSQCLLSTDVFLPATDDV